MTRTKLAAAVAALAHGIAAAEPAPAIVEIVGTTPLQGLGVARERIPANVQALDGDDMNDPAAATLPAALNRRLGSVFVNEIQGNPFQPDVSYRGFTASPLLGTPQGLSVYVDGVRMNQPFGDVVSQLGDPRRPGLVAQQGQLVLDEGMIDDRDTLHGKPLR